MRKQRKFLACLLSLAMVLALLPMSVLADEVPAAGGTSAVQVGTTETLTAAVAKGGEIQLTGDIMLNATLNVTKSISIDVNGHNLTINPNSTSNDGIHQGTNAELKFIDTGAPTGKILIENAHDGIWMSDGNLCLNNVNMMIRSTDGYGIYNLNESAVFEMTGGSLTIEDCATKSSNEGGIAWDGHDMTFNSGNVSIINCGSGSSTAAFGSLYADGNLTFGNGGNEPLTVNIENNPASYYVKNSIVMTGKNTTLTVGSNATVDISMAGNFNEFRGINIGGANTVVDVNGLLNISKNSASAATTVYGIRGAGTTPKLNVNMGGRVNISGYSAPENVLPNVYVTMNGGSMDLGGKFSTTPAAGMLQLDADAALQEELTIAADTTINTNGKNLTVTPAKIDHGVLVNSPATLTLADAAGAGVFTVDGENQDTAMRGIQCAGNLTIESGIVNVKNTNGYGIGGDAIGKAFKMTGGTLNVTDCGKGDEGGFIWSNNEGTCDFLGGTVNMTGCGKTLFGSIYTQCPTTFGDGTKPLTMNLKNNASGSAGEENTIFIGNTLTINKNATVNIALTGAAGQRRGINCDGKTVDINGGIFNVTNEATGCTTYGTRGANVVVRNGGALSIDKTGSGVADRGGKGSLTVKNDAVVNLAGTTSPTAGIPVVITGGSMNLGNGIDTAEKAGATSITNGKDTVGLQKQNANAYSVAINSTSKDSVYPYTYTSHVKEGGVYAWIPVSHVNFYDSDKTTLLGLCTDAGSSMWKDAKTAAPDMTGRTTFTGWVDANGASIADTTAVPVNGTLKVYAAYRANVPSGPSGGNTSSGDTTIIDPETPLADLPSALNSTDHFAYVQGYKDGTVRPNSNITRAETATMFYRLLTAERRDEIFTAKNNYSDVAATAWFNKAVSSMTAGQYLTGYPNGTFGANKNITRAEFVTIAVRFMAAKEGTVKFSDVSSKYWAHDAISTAVAYGWIDGYSDGTFRPEQPITRAEVMKIINTMLGRGVDAKGVMTGIKAWLDCANTAAWYYYDVVEATNSHEYSGTRPSETWKSLTTKYTYDAVKYENS